MARKEITIRISKEGEVFFIYDDDPLLREFGSMQVTRASNIRWDEEKQMWRIWLVNTDGTENRTDVLFTERKDAIQMELSVLDKMLEETESQVEGMFEKVEPAV